MRDVCIVGGGVAGLAVSIFPARVGLDTLVIDGGESILERNTSLENYLYQFELWVHCSSIHGWDGTSRRIHHSSIFAT